jgi:TPR repeat protein
VDSRNCRYRWIGGCCRRRVFSLEFIPDSCGDPQEGPGTRVAPDGQFASQKGSHSATPAPGITPEAALALAKSLPESPERADAAFLLLEFAADAGNPEAALAVGRYYDPTDETPSGTIRKNPETAYGWYRDALKGGQENAKANLAQLHSWVEKQAGEGSHEARELLNNWR